MMVLTRTTDSLPLAPGRWAILWVAALVVVVLLSTWPFNFQNVPADDAAWIAFRDSWGWDSHRGDIAGNVALFVPVGLIGLAAASATKFRPVRVVAMLAVSLAVAVAAQVAQLYLPSRSATLVDVAWNTVGLLAGCGVALLLRMHGTFARGGLADLRLLPAAIVAVWLAYRLAPFVPSVDLQLIKDNLKPLLLHPAPTVPATLGDLAAWLTVAILLRHALPGRRGDLLMPLLAAGTLVAEVLIVFRDGISANNVGGAAAAIVAWFALLRWLPRPAPLVFVALAAAVVLSGLWPFQFSRSDPAPFHWLPFRGILGGSMWVNVLALLEKTFFYAALAYTGWLAFRSWILSAGLGAAVVAAVEGLQRLQSGHVAELTDPLLVVLACLLFAALGDPAPTRRETARPAQPPPSPTAPSAGPRRRGL